MTEPVNVPPVVSPEAGYRLVKDASDVYRRTGNRVTRFRKQLAQAEREHEKAQRALRLAIQAVQPILPPAEPKPCCAVFDVFAEVPTHAPDCPESPQLPLTESAP